MKIQQSSIVFVLATLALCSCANTTKANQSFTVNKASNIAPKIHRCPANRVSSPVSFVVVVLNEKKLPVDALVPSKDSKVVKLDLNDPKLKLESIVSNNPAVKRDHGVKRRTKICFISAEKSSKTTTGLEFSPEKIAVLWRPFQSITFEKNRVFEPIPEKSPVGIAYKFSIATERSDPEKFKTYLDPRIVIKRL